MSRARSIRQDEWQTAASYENGSGCLSFYTLPVISAFLIIGLIIELAIHMPVRNFAASTIVSNTGPITTSIAVSNSISESATTQTGDISPIFTREVQYWAPQIVQWASATNLDPNLAATVMQIESCGDPRAISRAGAKGLFQVMPFHFYFGEDPYNPDTNALRGLSYLARSLQTANGNARLALAGYNGGLGVISLYEWMWGAETKRYIYYGVPIYEDASSGKTTSTMLDEWYEKYGVGLCRQASTRLGLTP